MWKKIISIVYLAIGGALSTYIIGSNLSEYTKHGWDVTIVTWIIGVLFSVPIWLYYIIKDLIKGVK